MTSLLVATLVPLLIGWFWKDRRWYARLGWPLITLAYLITYEDLLYSVPLTLLIVGGGSTWR